MKLETISIAMFGAAAILFVFSWQHSNDETMRWWLENQRQVEAVQAASSAVAPGVRAWSGELRQDELKAELENALHGGPVGEPTPFIDRHSRVCVVQAMADGWRCEICESRPGWAEAWCEAR